MTLEEKIVLTMFLVHLALQMAYKSSCNVLLSKNGIQPKVCLIKAINATVSALAKCYINLICFEFKLVYFAICGVCERPSDKFSLRFKKVIRKRLSSK